MNDNSDKKEENNKDKVEQNIERSIEEISESAENLTKEANILVEIEEFDEALEKYDKAIELYRQTNNNSEIEKIFELIELCYDGKSRFLRKAIKDDPEEKLKSKLEAYGAIQATDNQEQERLQRLMKLERDKEEEEVFKNTILQIARTAEKMEREYENAIKRGKFEEQPPFEKILQMYEDILTMLREEGWTDQLSVYRNQIKIIQGKATKDKKLREIEAKKKEKEEEYLKSMKLSERKKGEYQKIAAAHEKVRKGEEDTLLQQNIDKMVSEAKSLEREYNLAIKKGDFKKEPPFEKIIEIYQSVKTMLLDVNWKEQAMMYSNQINLIKKEIEKDTKLREIEAKKKEKEEEYSKSMTLSERKKGEYQKIAAAHEKVRKGEEDTILQQNIDKMVSEAKSLEREYNLAIKKGDFKKEPPFENIIEIYQSVKTMLLDVNWKEQAMMYSNQIKLIKKEIEKDTKLREIEAKKKKRKKNIQNP